MRHTSRAVQQLSALATSVIRFWELNSQERERAARITSMKPSRYRRQLAVTTAPINDPMIPSKATSATVEIQFQTPRARAKPCLPYFRRSRITVNRAGRCCREVLDAGACQALRNPRGRQIRVVALDKIKQCLSHAVFSGFVLRQSSSRCSSNER